jgi:hypothetical protein
LAKVGLYSVTYSTKEAEINTKCDAGMSVEDVPAVVNIKTLKGRLIAHKFSTGCAVGVVKSVEKKKSVAG